MKPDVKEGVVLFFLKGFLRTGRTPPNKEKARITETRTPRGPDVGDCMGSHRKEHPERYQYFPSLDADRL